MTDFMVKLPGNFRYVYQFANGLSQYKCVEACLAMAGQIAYPTRYAHPTQVMSEIYSQYVGPDVASDTRGTTKEQALEWLHSQNIGSIDMEPMLGNLDELHAEMQAQNRQNVPQIITIGDESFLHDAKTGHTLHNWSDALNHGAHTMLRVGYSDSSGAAYYMEPAAAPNFAEPVAISWQNFLDGHVVGCIAIMPHGVPTPPAGFSFQHGTWPAPKPPAFVFDKAKAESTLAAAMAALASLQHDLDTLKEEV
jgi:hypothetical protein